MFKYVQCTLYIYIVCVCEPNNCHLSWTSTFTIVINIMIFNLHQNHLLGTLCKCWPTSTLGFPGADPENASSHSFPLFSTLLWGFQMIWVISSQNLCQLRFFGFTNFPDGKVFATKKLVAARYGSGTKTASLQIIFFETKLREIAVQLFASSLYVHFMQRPPPDYYHLQSALKTAVPGSRPKYNIYTESRTRFVWTHLSFDQRKFRVLNRSWEQIFSRLKVCQNNFRQVLHRSKEKGEKQPILANGIREVGTGKNIKTQKYNFVQVDDYYFLFKQAKHCKNC